MPALLQAPGTAAGIARPSAGPFAPVAGHLEAAEKVFTTTLAGYRSPVAPLVEHLRHYRGKRLRPALLLLAADACGGVRPAHHALAAAVEMIHTATLVHDDVLDEADLRRHVRTVNAEWGPKVAVLFGDALFTHAFHLASTVDGRACRVIGEATNRVCGGELRQVLERGNLHLTEADYYAVIDGKTAALTECAARLGALYAGAGDETADRLAAFGRHLGRAFQIADDLLDLTATEETAGKTLGTDLEQRKLTLPLIHCLTELPAADADGVRGLIAAGGPGVRPVVASALARTGSLGYARRRAEDCAAAARQELAGLPPSASRAVLEQLPGWAVRREK